MSTRRNCCWRCSNCGCCCSCCWWVSFRCRFLCRGSAGRAAPAARRSGGGLCTCCTRSCWALEQREGLMIFSIVVYIYNVKAYFAQTSGDVCIYLFGFFWGAACSRVSCPRVDATIQFFRFLPSQERQHACKCYIVCLFFSLRLFIYRRSNVPTSHYSHLAVLLRP